MPEVTREQLMQLNSQDLLLASTGNFSAMSRQGQQLIGVGKSTALDMLDTGTSIAGSVIGGVLGGPVGAIAGGAAGAGIGAAIENKLSGTGGFGDIVSAAGTSAVFDTATLNAGKMFRFAKGFFGKGVDDIGSEFRTLVNQSAPDIADAQGRRIAAAQSQQMAMDRGASLPVSATESAGWFRTVVDQVGRSSILTKPFAEKQDKALQEAVVSSFNDLVRGAEKYETFEDIGNHFVTAITAGDEAAQAIYGKGLSEIQNSIANVDFSPKPIVNAVKQFLKDNEQSASKVVKENLNVLTSSGNPVTRDKVVSAGLSNLSQDVIKKATDIITELGNVNFKGKGVIEYQKKIRNMIADAYDANQPNIARQLVQLEESVKTGIEQSIRASGRRDIAEQYTSLNKTYREMKDSLFPTINATMMQSAMKTGDYSSIGKVLSSASGSNAGKVKSFMNSIDSSLKLVAENEGKNAVWAANEAKRIKRAARAGFVFHESNKLDGSRILSKGFVDNILKPENTAKMKAIFGDEWDDVKRAMNFAKTATRPGGRLGGLSLVLNSMQFNVLQAGVAAGVTFGSVEGTPAPNWVEGLAILAAPSVFYKIATRPQAINRLIALDNKIAKEGISKIKPEYIVSSLGKIMYSLEKQDIVESRAIAAEMGLPIYF